MRTQEEIFADHSRLMIGAADLLMGRSAQMEPTESDVGIIAAELDGKFAVRIFKQRSLRLYSDTLRFLAQEILSNDPHHSFFLLSHARTLLDVYARFLDLEVNCDTDAKRALKCIAYQLLTYTDISNDVEYQETLSVYKRFLDEQKNYVFPKTYKDMDSQWVGNNGLNFVKRSKLLTEEIMRSHSAYTVDVFGTKKTYLIYSYLSEFLHGNPYYYTGQPHNERFWVTSVGISTSAFLIELIDKYTFGKIQPRDFRIWLDTAKRAKDDFLSVWRSERARHNSTGLAAE